MTAEEAQRVDGEAGAVGVSEETAAMRASFDEVPEIYDRVRHDYPAEAVADLLSYLRERRHLAVPDVLEIGPGTGKATRALLGAGARVTGVELGDRMVKWLRVAFAEETRFSVVQGAFETVRLPAASFDIVTAATAFHWIDPTVRIEKAIELLRPLGVLSTISTVQVRSDVARGFFERTASIYSRYKGPDRPFAAPEPEEATVPEFDELARHPALCDAQLLRYRWDQRYSSDRYADLLRTYSNMLVMPEAEREQLIGELCELIESEFGGVVVRPLVVVLAMARRRPG